MPPIDEHVLNDSAWFATSQYLRQPIAVAFLEWNSRIGIPCDVWAMAITAVVRCNSCLLYRAGRAHIEHCNVLGACRSREDIK